MGFLKRKADGALSQGRTARLRATLDAIRTFREFRDKKHFLDLGIGENYPGHGIYIGIWEPEDMNGEKLGGIFNVFAAPQDLTDKEGAGTILVYEEAVKHVAKLKDWHGCDGADFKTDQDLYRALGNRTYNGEWFIPPLQILDGTDGKGRKVQEANLLDRREKGDLRGTFNTYKNIGSTNSCSYWSSTEPLEKPWSVYSVFFTKPYASDNSGKTGVALSTRLVRLEPRPRP